MRSASFTRHPSKRTHGFACGGSTSPVLHTITLYVMLCYGCIAYASLNAGTPQLVRAEERTCSATSTFNPYVLPTTNTEIGSVQKKKNGNTKSIRKVIQLSEKILFSQLVKHQLEEEEKAEDTLYLNRRTQY